MASNYCLEDSAPRAGAMHEKFGDMTEDFWTQFTTGIVRSPSPPATSSSQSSVIMRSSNEGDVLTPPSSSSEDEQGNPSDDDKGLCGAASLTTPFQSHDFRGIESAAPVFGGISTSSLHASQAALLGVPDIYSAQPATIQYVQDPRAVQWPMDSLQSLDQTYWTGLDNSYFINNNAFTMNWDAAGPYALPENSYPTAHSLAIPPSAHVSTFNDYPPPLHQPMSSVISFDRHRDFAPGFDTVFQEKPMIATAGMRTIIDSNSPPTQGTLPQQSDCSVSENMLPVVDGNGPRLTGCNTFPVDNSFTAMVPEQFPRLCPGAPGAATSSGPKPRFSPLSTTVAPSLFKNSSPAEASTGGPARPKRRRDSVRVSRVAKRDSTLQATSMLVLSPESSSASSSGAPRSKAMVGGRKGRLAENNRVEAGIMRKTGACWPCTVMRERCSEGDPCHRCASMSHRSKAHGLGCDRRQLKGDMMRSFIPVTMETEKLFDSYRYLPHDTSGWSSLPQGQEGIRVPFSMCFGSPLEWTCHEFERPLGTPTRSVVWNKMSWNEQQSRRRDDSWQRVEAPSAPLAIKHLDVGAFETWMESLIEQSLEDIGDMYFWEGHQLRTEILKIICQLYNSLQSQVDLNPSARVLRDDVHRVIYLVLVTFIMNHAFTLPDESRDTVIRQLSRNNDPGLYPEMLVLQTADSQLKCGFSKLRYKMHMGLLDRLQQILKHARYKEWWLSAFVIMLGLALTLEEYQHLLHVRADGEPEGAVREAQDNCADMDDGFEFLMRLYHYKYSIRSQTRAEFALWKNRTTHDAEVEFVESISLLFAQHRVVLLQRKDLRVSMSEDNHVLRLVGRFLTSVM